MKKSGLPYHFSRPAGRWQTKRANPLTDGAGGIKTHYYTLRKADASSAPFRNLPEMTNGKTGKRRPYDERDYQKKKRRAGNNIPCEA
jgi:hypothetical protein